MPDAKSAETRVLSFLSTAKMERFREETATGTIRIHRRGDAQVSLIPDWETERYKIRRHVLIQNMLTSEQAGITGNS